MVTAAAKSRSRARNWARSRSSGDALATVDDDYEPDIALATGRHALFDPFDRGDRLFAHDHPQEDLDSFRVAVSSFTDIQAFH